jgi:hypothetical protein
LNADVWGMIDQKKAYSYPFHGYYYFEELGNDTVAKLISENYGTLRFYLWKYFPFVRFGEYNNIYNPVRFIKNDKPSAGSFMFNKGTELLEKTNNMIVPEIKEDFRTDNYSVLNLKRIINLCRQQNVTLILFHSPDIERIRARNKDHGESDCVTVLKKIADENKIDFWDHSMVPELSGNDEYFFNPTHLNANGAKIFSGILADELNKKMEAARSAQKLN